jgi:hypothetical protein
LVPLVNIVEPNVKNNDNDNKDDNDNNNDNAGAVLRGGEETTNEWDFEEVARRRRAMEANSMAQDIRSSTIFVTTLILCQIV